jgi:hypothetical protein
VNKQYTPIRLPPVRIRLNFRNLPNGLVIRMCNNIVRMNNNRSIEALLSREIFQDLLFDHFVDKSVMNDLKKEAKNDQKVCNGIPSLYRRAYNYFLTGKTIRQIQKLFSRL